MAPRECVYFLCYHSSYHYFCVVLMSAYWVCPRYPPWVGDFPRLRASSSLFRTSENSLGAMFKQSLGTGLIPVGTAFPSPGVSLDSCRLLHLCLLLLPQLRSSGNSQQICISPTVLPLSQLWAVLSGMPLSCPLHPPSPE
jgi:hypothetical protein